MIALDAAQEANFRAALAVAPGPEERARLAFAIWSESKGRVYANDGRNTSSSPGVTPEIAAILRRSLGMPHDAVGSNGRSTGILQQLSSDVGGGWGDMAGTMDPATAARRFLAALRVTDDPVYDGWLVTPTGRERVSVATPSPVVADVLRVQQPLASEARSSNYGPGNLAAALEISARFTPTEGRSAAAWLQLFAAAIAAGRN